ncbi:hypothetical protein FA15DRAFT_666947 [Coprinopsis marcescibilis]|uniref:Uncharacterized protein n=1 Tax=Coprinopsis marcescibilis TaxID=230819 RepID=A0A5C3L4C8_COPMA|nr:hypothetical protein FA15DRAFT_666947 [Coprinopsis marcescibilis]
MLSFHRRPRAIAREEMKEDKRTRINVSEIFTSVRERILFLGCAVLALYPSHPTFRPFGICKEEPNRTFDTDFEYRDPRVVQRLCQKVQRPRLRDQKCFLRSDILQKIPKPVKRTRLLSGSGFGQKLETKNRVTKRHERTSVHRSAVLERFERPTNNVMIEQRNYDLEFDQAPRSSCHSWGTANASSSGVRRNNRRLYSKPLQVP